MTARLIAIDGTHGGRLTKAAMAVHEAAARERVAAVISRWDASGLFADVAAAPADTRDLSPRTLLLLYAADLAFRLRWEIQPALAEGLTVIAAPYLATPIAFGLATGLPSDWVRHLLRFAPEPGRAFALRPRDRAWKHRPDRGFAECCATLLTATPPGLPRRKTRQAMAQALEAEAVRIGGTTRLRALR